MLRKHFEADSKKFEEYLAVCERLGKEPDLNKMPMQIESFPYEVQAAFYIHDILPDRWDGSSGSYMGKDWSAVGTLLERYTENQDTILFFLKTIDNIRISVLNEQLQAQRDREDRKSQGKMNFPKGE